MSYYQEPPAYWQQSTQHRLWWALTQWQAVEKMKREDKRLKPHIYRLTHAIYDPVAAYNWAAYYRRLTKGYVEKVILADVLRVKMQSKWKKHLKLLHEEALGLEGAPIDTPIDGNVLEMLDTNLAMLERLEAKWRAKAKTPEEYAKGIKRDFLKELRSHIKMTAENEWSKARNKGVLLKIKNHNERLKVWITVGDNKVCPNCQDNASIGPIGIDRQFPTGIDNPPEHPRCRCHLEAGTL